ncbi:hypothetical protein F4820DRAFT_408613 [Hypoxylon rubiginosum]|uniref:Uncharacterized protein n=1 Tax=Hypoxylon rubiginosum TaxID=110542 RepID=A0ACB9ZCJ3_9PEZI|nr:hypothetical protein F4820DRAFT_408613 [Hypoxylon rubiginosum]
MSSRGREYDRHSSTRTRSRSGAFLEALGGGHVRDAIGALKPGPDPSSEDRHHHHRRHHGDDDYYYYDEYLSDDGDDDYYYYEETRPHQRHRSTHTERRSHDKRVRDRPSRRSASTGPNLKQAAEAAVAAGVVEAWRSRRDRDRTARVATAAIGAAATDALINKDGDRTKKRHVIESVIAGLAENRVVNGSRR